MSMQRIENYGSFLQAYGLKQIIEGIGHTVEFVDYKVEPSVVAESKDNRSKKTNIMIRLIRMLSPKYRKWRTKQIKMNRTFSTFCEAYRNQFLPQLGGLDRDNILPKLDTLVIGSDEVFNCTQKGKRVGYSRQLFGKDNRALRVISYAASFGNTTFAKLVEYGIADEVGKLLSGFDALSVRDENSESIIKKLCDIQAQKHIDPVLLYDFPEVNDIQINLNNYIIIYAYADRIHTEEAFAIRKFAKENNKEIISLGFYQPFCDKYILANPLEVLAYVKNADYVVTDTFHGTVFSIKYQKKFATIIRESNYQKLGNLLEMFDLGNRAIKSINELGNILNAVYDTDSVKGKIELFQKQAKTYLMRNL